MDPTAMESRASANGDTGLARNSLLESLHKYQKQLGYSASELQMIISDLAALQSVDIVPDPTPQLLDLLSQSALSAFDLFDSLDAKSAEALNTGKGIEAKKKRLAQLFEEEQSGDKTATSASAVLDEKLDLSKGLVRDCEDRFDALNEAREALKSGLDGIPQLQTSATEGLSAYEKELIEQNESLVAKQSAVLNALSEHDEFLRANQLEIDALEARLKALKEEREKRIAEAEEANNEEKRVYLEDAVKMNKLATTAVSAENTLIGTSMSNLEKKWKERSTEVTSALSNTLDERVVQFENLASTLAIWIQKKDQKLALLKKLVENADQAEQEGLQVTIDVHRTKKDIDELTQALQEQRELQTHVDLRLKELRQEPIPSWHQSARTPKAAQAPKQQSGYGAQDRGMAGPYGGYSAPPQQQTGSLGQYGQPPQQQQQQQQYGFRPSSGQQQGMNGQYGYSSSQQTPYSGPGGYGAPPQSGFGSTPYGGQQTEGYGQGSAPYSSQGGYGQQQSQPSFNQTAAYSAPSPRSVQFDEGRNGFAQPDSSRYHAPREQSRPGDETYKKIKELGMFDDATARRAAEMGLPVKETVDKLLNGTLFDSAPPSRPAAAPTPATARPAPSRSYPASSPSSSATTPSRSKTENSNFGSDLQIQEKSLLKKTTWRDVYLILNVKKAELVYGPVLDPEMAKLLDVLTEDDVKVEGRHTINSTWSCFEKADPDGYVFEVHNPKAGSSQMLFRAATRDLRNDWIRRIKTLAQGSQTSAQPTQSSGSGGNMYPSVAASAQTTSTMSTTSSSSASTRRPSNSANTKDLVSGLEKMGFSKKHAEKAADGAADINEALERVMTIQTLEGGGGGGSAEPAPTSRSTSLSRVEPPAPAPSPSPRSSAPSKGMAKCGNCGTGFSYPIGAQRVECHSCHTINNIAPSAPPSSEQSMVALQCGLCKQRVDVPRGQDSFVCPECSIVNKIRT